MRRSLLLLAIPLLACEPAVEPPGYDPVADVDPTIGTAGGGWAQPQVFVGATLPFGMVRLGPDTSGDLPRGLIGFAHTSGYWYQDPFIDGFSHLHLSGTGMEDLGTLLVMPSSGIDSGRVDEDGYRQPYDHADEKAVAGKYEVVLGSDVHVELSATHHAGIHRYTFPVDEAEPVLILDVGHGIGRPGALDAEVTVNPETGAVEGFLLNAGRFTGEDNAFPIHFSLTLDPAPAAFGAWNAGTLEPGATTTTGPDIGLWAELSSTEVTVRAGFSLIDLEQARTNRAEVDERSLDDVASEAEASWRDALSTIELEAELDDTPRRILTTALYHSILTPTNYSEGGRYMGLDRAVHDDEGVPFFSDLSMWDTYRTAHPLYALLYPAQAEAASTSILRMVEQDGRLPRWPLAVNETGTMLGSPASIILADAYLRGATGFDTGQALDAMITDAESGRGDGYARCLELGFCPREEVGRATAHAVEWGWADFAIAELAAALGDARAADFSRRSQLPRGHLDETGFFRGRNADGSFDPIGDFDPTLMGDDYAEGNAWHYLFSAPYDLVGLIDGLGGKDAFLAKADEMFDLAAATPPKYLVDEFRQPDPYYWHGNEPPLHGAFVYSLAGEPAKTADRVRWILDEKYADDPWGLEGNDDAGTLSAWYVLASVGLFPLPGSDVWILVPPVTDLTLHRRAGPLRVRSEGEGRYIGRVLRDGAPHDRAWISHAELAETDVLTFEMADSAGEFGRAQPWIDEPRP
jgi:predicted alpha-1,2-mannosidase